MYFWEQIINGLSLGVLYALIAVGFSMVYGVLKLLNFAHSEIITIGTYTAFLVFNFFADNIVLTFYDIFILLLIAALMSGLMNILLFFLGYKNIYKKSKVAVLITAIGFSIIIQNVLKIIFGAKSIGFFSINDSININFLTFNILLISAFLIYYLLKKTNVGIWIRAVADDTETAELMGVNSTITIMTIFFIGGAMAGIAGVIMSIRDGFINPYMGFLPGLKSFSIAVVGGIGNLKGAVIIGILLGLFEVIIQSFLPGDYTQLRDILAFLLLLTILIIKPKGLFGEKII